MARKISPFLNRIGIIRSWKSKWFSEKNYCRYLKDDANLRKFLESKLSKAAIDDIIIERYTNVIVVNIHSARPGIVIGRGGTGVEELRSKIIEHLGLKTEIRVNIIEIRRPELSAKLVAKGIAEQIEKRSSFRKTMKQAIEKTMNNKEAKGIKISISGRLDGAEMARREWLSKGKIPLQTLRADIDFAKHNAYTSYGVVGIKVWIYKGEVFN